MSSGKSKRRIGGGRRRRWEEGGIGVEEDFFAREIQVEVSPLGHGCLSFSLSFFIFRVFLFSPVMKMSTGKG